MCRCCAIFVTYNPDLSTLEKSVLAIINQVDMIFIIDNASTSSLKGFFSNFENVKGVLLGKNVGIATGFNIGIQLARRAGYSYLLLLDQDSIPPPGMIMSCWMAIDRLRLEGHPVAAVGPRYRDPRTSQISSFVRFKWFRNSYVSSHETSSVVNVDFLISSGSFYPIEVFDKVGMFNEEFFIDHVDTEWCHRAASLGFKFFGVPDLIMDHSLGESRVRLWFIRWRSQPLHKPFRLYFIVRNSLLMYRMNHVPLKWISGDVFRLARLLAVYMIFSPSRFESIKCFFGGFSAGIRKILGHSQVIINK